MNVGLFKAEQIFQFFQERLQRAGQCFECDSGSGRIRPICFRSPSLAVLGVFYLKYFAGGQFYPPLPPCLVSISATLALSERIYETRLYF